MKLLGASLFTLTIISSFVLFIIVLALLYLDTFDLGFAISLTVGINFLLWLIGPLLTDYINKWFYKVHFLTKEEVEKSYPQIAQVINEVSAKHSFKFPKVGIIVDKNPTAFTYGIVEALDDQSSLKLLESTRHLGLVDVKNAKHVGVITHISKDSQVLAEVMVFDKINPWAKLIEFSSTHPLTGNRLGNLSRLSKKLGQTFSFDIDGVIRKLQIQKSKLYTDFIVGIYIYFAPTIFFLLFLLFMPVQLIPI